MKVLKKYNQHRRDCYVDLKCEGCNNLQTNKGAYDDRNYWDNVIPDQKCSECNKSSIDLGEKVEKITTRYSESEVI